jgi:uncharacterized coiled-coil protein SlyX
VSHSLGLVIESLVAILLMLTIGYCMLLNQRLKRLRSDEQFWKATISELVTATEIAERAVSGLKRTAHECEATLGERLEAAEQRCAELERQIAAGDGVLTRLSRVVVAARALNAAPAKSSPPTDAKALSLAARSFADRLRERVGALAA